MKTNIYSCHSDFNVRRLTTASNSFSAKLYFILLIFFLLPCFTQAQRGQNDPTFNTADNIAAHGANDVILKTALQSDNKIIIVGKFTRYNGTEANGFARLRKNGKFDETFNMGSGVNGSINAVTILPNDKIIIAGDFTSYNGVSINKIAKLQRDGSLDNYFNPGIGANGPISNVIIQPDRKILVLGSFTEYNSVPVRGLVRLNRNGSVDNTFHAVITDSLDIIEQIGLLPDGKIIVSGDRHNQDGFGEYIFTIRLTANGQRDYSFVSELQIGDQFPLIKEIITGTDGKLFLAGGFNDGASGFTPFHGKVLILDSTGTILEWRDEIFINDIVRQADGKILIAGFEIAGDVNTLDHYRKKIVRLNEDLTTDSTFSFVDNKRYPEDRIYSEIQSIAIQNQNIIMCGNIADVNGPVTNHIARLYHDGSFDHTFNRRSGCDGAIFATALQDNGKTIIAGEFSRFNFVPVSNIARLSPSGSIDNNFHSGSGTNGRIYTIALTSDHKIIIGGAFTSYNGHACQNIVRLYGDGSIDMGFTAQADDVVRKIMIDQNGKIMVAGHFNNVNGVSRSGIARLEATGALDYTFNAITVNSFSHVSDCNISATGEIYIAINQNWAPLLFASYVSSTELVRLNNVGSLDLTFNIPTGIFYEINTIAFNNDGKILVGGRGIYYTPFEEYKGIVAQLNTDGSLDATFDHTTLGAFADQSYLTNETVRTINVLNNGKVVAAGDFVKHITMLNSNGSVNANFVGSTDDNIYTTTLVGTEKLIIGGIFSEYGDNVRNSVARINLNYVQKAMTTTLVAALPTNELTFDVYPNPATSEVNVNNLKTGSVLTVYNSIGKKMYSEILTDNRTTIKLSDYSNGIYFLINENDGVKTSSKFVVNK